MIIGLPKEIKNHEYRVALTPSGINELAKNGHKIIVQKSSGLGAGFSDEEYISAGGHIASTPEEVFDLSDMIIKVKEPLPQEYRLFHNDQILFTYLHLASNSELAGALLEKRVIGFGYETVQTENGSLPLLTPMSEIAGKLSVQIGAHYLEKQNGGSGILLGGIPGVEPGNVTIIGGGSVGLNAARVAVGMGAHVTLLDINPDRLRFLENIFVGRVTLLTSNPRNIEKSVIAADLVIGAVLVPGYKAPKIVTHIMISKMRKGSVIVDIAIDQGGCFETSVPTSFDDPVFILDGIIHYCVTNLPACVPRTSTLALTSSTFPYIFKLANIGYKEALRQDIAFKTGLNVYRGQVTNKPVAEAVGKEYISLEKAVSFL
jgi:alanine dehydrogenase